MERAHVAAAAGLIRLAGFARLDPQVQRRSGRSHLLLRCLFLPTITAPTNGNCFGFFCVLNSTREPQSGWAEPVEMWAEGPHHCGFGSGDERRKQGHACPRWNPRWMQNIAALWANVQEPQMSRGCRRDWECSSSLLELIWTSEPQMFPSAPKRAESEPGSHPPFGAAASTFSLLFVL